MAGAYIPPPIFQSTSAGSAALYLSRADAKLADIYRGVGWNDVDGRRFEDEEERKRTAKEESRHWWLTVGHSVFASVSMISSLITLRVATWRLTKLAFSIPLVAAPYAVRQRRQLNRKETVRGKLNKLRGEVNHLAEENNKLNRVNEMLTKEVSKLQATEEELRNIVTQQGGDLQEFCNLVKEYDQIQREMQKRVEAKAQEAIVSSVLRSADDDLRVDDDGIDRLVVRLRAHPDLSQQYPRAIRQSLTSSGSRSVATILTTAHGIRASSLEPSDVPAVVESPDFLKTKKVCGAREFVCT